MRLESFLRNDLQSFELKAKVAHTDQVIGVDNLMAN